MDRLTSTLKRRGCNEKSQSMPWTKMHSLHITGLLYKIGTQGAMFTRGYVHLMSTRTSGLALFYHALFGNKLFSASNDVCMSLTQKYFRGFENIQTQSTISGALQILDHVDFPLIAIHCPKCPDTIWAFKYVKIKSPKMEKAK